jgi:hypothetical protein
MPSCPLKKFFLLTLEKGHASLFTALWTLKWSPETLHAVLSSVWQSILSFHEGLIHWLGNIHNSGQGLWVSEWKEFDGFLQWSQTSKALLEMGGWVNEWKEFGGFLNGPKFQMPFGGGWASFIQTTCIYCRFYKLKRDLRELLWWDSRAQLVESLFLLSFPFPCQILLRVH